MDIYNAGNMTKMYSMLSLREQYLISRIIRRAYFRAHGKPNIIDFETKRKEKLKGGIKNDEIRHGAYRSQEKNAGQAFDKS